ncbi:MAG: oligosaccharide flippase family protein, partial [Dactylosporangium sp.]|nr:oligosaccharide flippase family protein [Dactylosporangium sp.]NNJ62606.1 oligosaccharide flippase family protein [Dactylosporangium sp.]
MRLRSLPSPVDLGRFWFMLALAAVGVGNMGFHVIVSRLMGPAEYGAFGSLLALMVLVTVPAGGVQTLITARTARIVESGRLVDGTAAFGRFRRAGAICAIAMLAAAPLLQGFLRLDSIWPICWLALYCLFPVAIVVPWGWLCGQGKFAVVGTIAIAGTVIRISVGILLIQAGFGVSGAIMASVAADSCQLVALYLASNRVRARDRARAVSLGIDPRAAIGGVLAVTGLWLLVG